MAVAQTFVAGEAVHSERVLGTDGALPVAVLRQVALVLLVAALPAPGQDLCVTETH